MTLPMLASYRLLPRLLAAERLARILRDLFRFARNEPGPVDPAELSPHWLRDIGLPEDYGRPSRADPAEWARLEHRR